MNENWFQPKNGPATLQLSLGNLSAADVKFLKSVVSIFTDPNLAFTADRIRLGDFAINRDPEGFACVIALENQEGPSIREVVNFFASFTPLDWEELKAHKDQLYMLARVDVGQARRFAGQILGHLPAEETMTVGQG
jgi:hypothetical protein